MYYCQVLNHLTIILPFLVTVELDCSNEERQMYVKSLGIVLKTLFLKENIILCSLKAHIVFVIYSSSSDVCCRGCEHLR